MDLFPNARFVRLRSRGRDKYVHADDDGRGVCLRRLGDTPSVNAVWKVEHWPEEEGGGTFFLLQGAAYGRYLSASNLDAPRGHRGVRILQSDYISAYLELPFKWTPHRVEAGQNYVRLHNDDNDHRCLRANGKYRHWNNLVTADARNDDETTMMQWRVEAIPLSPVPMPLPPPFTPPIHVRGGKRWDKVHTYPGRMIRHVRLEDDASAFHDDWPEFEFDNYSASQLRNEVVARQDDDNITLCVRAGMYALVIPLITDLPHNVDPMEIVVVTTGSPAFEMLEYPQFDAPEP